MGYYETEEEKDDRDGDKDAVFVTDGDSDVGQVCVFTGFHRNHHTYSMQQDERNTK